MFRMKCVRSEGYGSAPTGRRAPTDEVAQERAVDRGRRRVLVVDDDPIVRVMLEEILAEGGFAATAVSGAAEALELLGDGHGFAAVVTDLAMPEKSGLDLLRDLRDRRQYELPVVILTGSPTLESAIAAVGDARVRYITKDEAHAALLTALQDMVEDDSAVRRPASETRQRTASLVEDEFDEVLGQLWMAFQPIVSWRRRTVFGYEALVRSKHPVVSNPGLLFETAERLDRLQDLGRRIRTLIAQCLCEAPPEAIVFVNLHSTDLNDEELYDRSGGLARYADRIVFEVTERASLQCVHNLPERLRALRAAGYSIAVDDLGAGYAGLASFGQLEPEVVKLDMSLVRNIESQPRLQRVVRSMLSACAGDSEILVVCEGVETAAERDVLVELGADLLQGYLFARPAPGFTEASF